VLVWLVQLIVLQLPPAYYRQLVVGPSPHLYSARMRTLVGVVAAVVIVAVIGFAVARSSRGGGDGSGGTPPALSNHAATTSFRVSYPADWHRLSTPPTGLLPPLGDALALAPKASGRELVIGTTSVGGSASGQLPAALSSALSETPQGAIVNLGGHQLNRYLDLSIPGQGLTESVYLLPTTAGTIGAVCAIQKPSAAFTATCERVLATLQLTSGTALSLGIDTGYALHLNAIVAQLNRARGAVGPGLQTGSLHARALAAQRLAAAHAQAAAAAGRLTPSGAGLEEANRTLVSALDQTADDYRTLGRAIADRRQAAYESAQAKLDADARTLGAAFTSLRELGYRIG
jgi:hypothetical protein